MAGDLDMNFAGLVTGNITGGNEFPVRMTAKPSGQATSQAEGIQVPVVPGQQTGQSFSR